MAAARRKAWRRASTCSSSRRGRLFGLGQVQARRPGPPNRKQADSATALALVCRRPLGIVSIIVATPRTFAAFVDVDCLEARSLHLVTAPCSTPARRGHVLQPGQLESAQKASVRGPLRAGASALAPSATRHLKLFYAARNRPNNVITAKSLLDARILEAAPRATTASTTTATSPAAPAAEPPVLERRRAQLDRPLFAGGAVVSNIDAAAASSRSRPRAATSSTSSSPSRILQATCRGPRSSSASRTARPFDSGPRTTSSRRAARRRNQPGARRVDGVHTRVPTHRLERASTADTRVCWLNGDVNDIEVEAAVTHDALLAIGSLIFVYLCMIVHTRSPIVAMAMAQVLASVPIGVYLHRALFHADQFYVLNFLGLFIIAGIGADDSLLFDVWKAEVDRGPARTLPRFPSRPSAGASMAVTSISSAASFFAAYSTLPALRSFGIFCGTPIMVNFAFVMLASRPPVVRSRCGRRPRTRASTSAARTSSTRCPW